uniref:3'-5' exonuclease domain-containing protein n=1 Tax=Ditylenchus dipsaci TaxID=166011 RepID=A0A915E8L0_9BILA
MDLDKSEKLGNWVQRPLRLEQKKYAAMDAYALVGCFEKIASRLICMTNIELLASLQKNALLGFDEKKDLKNNSQERV